MDRWVDKIAVVTGASSGIGEAIVKDLLKANIIVVGLARRFHRLEEIKSNLPDKEKNRFYPIKCDVTIESDIKNAFEWIETYLGGADILINNAGMYKAEKLIETDMETVRKIIDTNVNGLICCTQEAYRSMKSRNINGHIVLISSIAGHKVAYEFDLNIYSASKFAVTAIAETLRQEFIKLKNKTKITNISPGLVETELFGDSLEVLKEITPFLKPEDVSGAILYALGTPPHVQVHELIIKPIGEKF